MPKRVDHEVRRRQITDALARITARGGLSAATFREVASEAGVSVALVQYYFGTKADLLLATQQQLASVVGARLRHRIEATPDDPRARGRAIFAAFVPQDDESRRAMLLFVAFYTASLTQAGLARPEAQDIPDPLAAILAGAPGRDRPRPGGAPRRAGRPPGRAAARGPPAPGRGPRPGRAGPHPAGACPRPGRPRRRPHD